MTGSRLAGRGAVVTGAAAGIGLATTLQLLQRGAEVVAVDVSEPGCAELEKLIAERGLTGHVLRADLADTDGVAEVARRAAGLLPDVTALVNVAGRVVVQPFLDTTPEDWIGLLRTNLLSTTEMTRALIPAMTEAGGGTVVNMASLSGSLATPLESIYCVTKAAIMQFTKAVAVEFRAAGIRCNCVSPAMVDTQHGRTELAELGNHGLHMSDDDIAAGQVRLARPDEIARAIVFLSEDESSFVNGAELVIDNAWSAGAGA